MTDDVDDVAVRRLINGDRSIPLYRRRQGSRGPLPWSPEALEAIRVMTRSGMSDRQIAERLGHSRSGILMVRRRYGIPSAQPRTTRTA